MLFASNPRNTKGIVTGQGLVEYALILSLVAIVVVAAIQLLGPLVGNVFKTINASI